MITHDNIQTFRSCKKKRDYDGFSSSFKLLMSAQMTEFLGEAGKLTLDIGIYAMSFLQNERFSI